MSAYQCELFGHFVYSEDLSYADLLEQETNLISAFDRLLRDMDAAHIDFTPTGDALRVQCMFAEADDALLRSVCDAVAPLIANDIKGKMLFVDKDLAHIALYCLEQSAWKESFVALPDAHGELKRSASRR